MIYRKKLPTKYKFKQGNEVGFCSIFVIDQVVRDGINFNPIPNTFASLLKLTL